jgi:hypothetical protein
LNNDEQVMLRYRRHSFPTVVEIQRTLSDQALESADPPDPAGSRREALCGL